MMSPCSQSTHTSLQHLDLAELNQRFESAHPLEILAWAIANVPSGLVQSTAFGVDGLVILDLLYRELHPQPAVPVLFLDTLHHFPETLELARTVTQTYGLDLRTYHTLDASTREEFARRYGDRLWETDVNRFHHVTKVEPLQRGLQELGAIAWITGRRRDQSSSRANLPIMEWDDQHRLKINPLATWSYKQVWSYIFQHGLTYNPLHDQGYASIGDEPLTTPITQGESERDGRWRGSEKTECGIHGAIA
jgi:phosphoadenosine phosphosulfate reductase